MPGIEVSELFKLYFTGSIALTAVSFSLISFLSDKYIKQISTLFLLAIAALASSLSLLSVLAYIYMNELYFINLSGGLLCAGGSLVFISIIPILITIIRDTTKSDISLRHTCPRLMTLEVR